MINWIKYLAAKFFRWQMMPLVPNQITEKDARKFNILQGIIMTGGRAKWNWKAILKR